MKHLLLILLSVILTCPLISLAGNNHDKKPAKAVTRKMEIKNRFEAKPGSHVNNKLPAAELNKFFNLSVSSVSPQNDTWGAGIGINPTNSGLSGMVNTSLYVHPNLYIGGSFTNAFDISEADNIAVYNVETSEWSAIGTGFPSEVRDIAADNDGNLYISHSGWTPWGDGTMGGLVKWDGSVYSAVGGGISSGYKGFNSIEYDKTNNILYMAGWFTSVGGVSNTSGMAYFQNGEWHAMGRGIDFGTSNSGAILKLAADGTLYVGGDFKNVVDAAGDSVANTVSLARWKNAAWESMGLLQLPPPYLNQYPKTYSFFIDGTDVYVGGLFANNGGNPDADYLARYNTTDGQWYGVVEIQDIYAYINTISKDGNGDLIVAGRFADVNSTGIKNIFRWDGTTVSAVGNDSQQNSTFLTLAIDNNDVLYAGGSFSNLGGDPNSNYLSKIDTPAENIWSHVFTILPPGIGLESAYSVASDGQNVYVGGSFSSVGGNSDIQNVARWTGSGWAALGKGVGGGYVSKVAVYNGNVYVGGYFSKAFQANGTELTVNNVARWNIAEEQWYTVGGGLAGDVYTFGFDNGLLYVGGYFSSVLDSEGNQVANTQNFASWNGTEWLPIGQGVDYEVNAITAHNGFLYVGGYFYGVYQTNGDYLSAANIAKWNGSEWSTLGSGLGLNGDVNVILPYGNSILVAGAFTDLDYSNSSLTGNLAEGKKLQGDLQKSLNGQTNTPYRLALWDGTSWNGLSAATYDYSFGEVTDILISGSDLFISGSGLGSTQSENILRFDGTTWNTLGGGTNGAVGSMAFAEHTLYLAGNFTKVDGTISSQNFAWWYPVYRYILQEGDLDPAFDSDGKRVTDLGDYESVSDLALDHNGKTVIVGSSGGDVLVARHNADGSFDTSFNSDGYRLIDLGGTSDGGRSVKIQPDGKIVIAGRYSAGFGTDAFALIRLNSNGSFDASFGENGVVLTDNGNNEFSLSVAIQPDGKIVLAGFSSIEGSMKGVVSRYTKNGSADPDFASAGTFVTTESAQFYGIGIQNDGKIIISGRQSGLPVVARFTSGGLPDQDFGTSGISSVDFGGSPLEISGNSVVLQPDGKILLVTNNESFSPSYNVSLAIARLNADGSLDTGFGDGNGKVIASYGGYHYGYVVSALEGGKILVAGRRKVGVDDNVMIVRYNSNGTLDNSFNVAANSIDFGTTGDRVYALAVKSDGKIVFAGDANGDYLMGQLGGSVFAAPFESVNPETGTFTSATFTSPSSLLVGSVLVTGQLTLGSTSIVNTNGYGINLGLTGSLSGETPSNYLVGSISATRNLTTASENIAGLGISIDPQSNNLGATTITRESGATASIGGNIQQVWTISPETQPSGPVTVTLTWPSGNDNALVLETLVVFKSSNEGVTWNQVAEPVFNLASDPRTVTFTISSFSMFTIGEPDAALPVELSAFTGKISGGKVVLNWSTTTETNNYGWEIQKSEDSPSTSLRDQKTEWETIGFVAGKGTTTDAQSYSFSSPVAAGSLKFRLKQIDVDGKTTYSQIVSIEGKPTVLALNQNYPNPFNPSTTIGFALPASGKVNLVVYDILGREVATLLNREMESGFQSVVFDASSYSAGVYFYKISFNGQVITKKLTLLK